VVKNEIKMKVAKNMRRASEESLPYPSPGLSIKKENDELTTDDEEKRRRRRLRNKIAAEKCRNKRKKAIEKLYSESETVAVQNAKFKDDIARLEAEHRHLLMVLEQHKPLCRRNCGRDSNEAVISHIEDVKTEREDLDLFEETKIEYKFAGEMYDSVSYNFNSYPGGYYDNACFAI